MKITRLEPWLVRVQSTGWGEYLFVEVRTDEGLTGWGEITTTTRSANRAVAAIIRQLNDLVAGEDPGVAHGRDARAAAQPRPAAARRSSAAPLTRMVVHSSCGIAPRLR